MPRSSRHKSSKHSSREYSDSEKDSSLKEKKAAAAVKEENISNSSSVRVSSEKRKLDLKENKENKESLNGEYAEEYSSSSSKRRKERAEENNDRWNGGEEERGEKKGKEKGSEDKSKSRRRDDSVEKKSEGKYRDNSRKEEREREKDREREKRGKEGRSEKRIEVVEYSRGGKQVSEKTGKVTTGWFECGILKCEVSRFENGSAMIMRRRPAFKAHKKSRQSLTPCASNDQLRSPESENQTDRRIRRKRDDSVGEDKQQDDFGDANGKRLSSREDVVKDGKPKDEKYNDDRYRDKYHEDTGREHRHQDDKQKDERGTRDNINSRSDEKHARSEKDGPEIRKKSKPQDDEHDHDHEIDIVRDRDRSRDRERDRDRDRERDRDRDHERILDYDGAHIDDRSVRYKDSRGRRRSPEDHDDYNDTKSKGIKTPYPDMEKKSSSSGGVETDDRGRSQSRQAHLDNNVSSNRRRTSPDTSSHGAVEEYRHFKAEESKYKDAVIEQRSKAISSREATDFPVASERASKYRSSDKPIKMDDGHLGELLIERSSSSRVSPRGLVDRSPSSSHERRYANRSGVRRSIDIEESTRRRSGSISARDFPSAEDRLGRDLPMEKPLADESTPADSSFYNRTNQNNSALIPPPSFRGGGGSPSFMGSLEEDSRANTRYKRGGGDPNLGRGQGNAWRGTPNWASPMPNGYMPFQHGPHGGFQAMMPHFASPPLFGARPSMEINHSGIPYHIPDADRFSGHLRPLGWHNMMDGSGPSHMHGWDGNNGVYRDEPHAYGQEWDQNTHQLNGRGWETGTDIWKAQNGDVNIDLPAAPMKEDFPVQAPLENVLAGQVGHQSQNENTHQKVQAEIVETKLAVASAKDSFRSMPKTSEKMPDLPKMQSRDDRSRFARAYLSKLDISTELASPELYSQCMNFLSMEQGANADEDIVMLDGARAVPKSFDSIFSLSLLPATNDAVFQRAMDCYKKERVGLSGLPIVNGGTINFKVKEESIDDGKKAEEPVLNQDEEMHDVPVLKLDQKKAEDVTLADTHEAPEELVSTPSQKDHAHACTPSQVFPDQALSQDGLEKPVEIPSGNMIDGVPSEPVNSGVEGSIASPNNASQASSISPTEVVDNNALQCAEEGRGAGDAVCGALFFSDDSLEASGALGSNESESVILSRIHHSPERIKVNLAFHAFFSSTSSLRSLRFGDRMIDIQARPASHNLSFMDMDIR
ncbi:hypothetical protein SADUNF_Sadunf15G0013700 [Salix dunnii]|uniref:Uncharacterized protein n=1 Tax=Salix dunnii TaxID=1413687 RepID=A0A835JFD9_9ROSI|nr:hypothetical protein SADUNF_Sadunf15G0013700 [Salix dunnii]